MKTLNEILKQAPIYMNDWSDKIDVISDFDNIHISKDEYYAEKAPYKNERWWNKKKAQMNVAIEKWKDINILFASYSCANYSGEAFVLFEQDGKLFEVNGSHCSCYGLEGQFEPEEVNLEVLKHRLTEGTFGEDNYADNNFKKEMCEFIGVEFKKNSRQY